MAQRVAVIGSGTWGTAVTHLLGGKGYEVSLWTRNENTAQAINQSHHNPRHLPAIELPNTTASSDFEQVLRGVDAIVFVTPSAYVRQTAEQMAPYVDAATPAVILSKGVEAGTGYTMIEVLADAFGREDHLACLAGPNHAEEVSRELIAATVVASSEPETARFFQMLFSTPYFRVYTSDDVLGVELCAAAKNIIAIANGMLVAMNLGDDASAALITRGLAEISRLVEAAGGNPRTCAGLAGMGDLVVTCTSEHSRNRALGTMLAQGGTLEEYESRTHMVAEGAVACRTVTDRARKLGVEMPIAEAVRQVLWGGLSPEDGIDLLVRRPERPELD